MDSAQVLTTERHPHFQNVWAQSQSQNQNQDPEAIQANIAAQQWNDYNRFFSPLVGQMQSQANSTDLVDSTRMRLGNMATQAQGMQQRQSSRALAGLTPAQQQALERRQNMNLASDSNAQLNTARGDQRDMNFQTNANLVNIAMGLGAQGSQGMGQAAGMASQREQNYQNARAQNRNSMISTGASLGALALIGGI